MLLISKYVILPFSFEGRCYVVLELRETALTIDIFTLRPWLSLIFPFHFHLFLPTSYIVHLVSILFYDDGTPATSSHFYAELMTSSPWVKLGTSSKSQLWTHEAKPMTVRFYCPATDNFPGGTLAKEPDNQGDIF